MLTQKPNVVKKMVTLLTDPEASYLSLVKQPANRTPFAVLKSEDVRTLKTENDMSKDTTTTALIHKFQFDKEQFGSEESVRKHMDSHGYEAGYTVEDSDAVFVIKGVDESAFESIEPIADTVAGVTMFVGTQKSVVTESEDPEAIKKDAESDDKPEDTATPETTEKTEEVVEEVEKTEETPAEEVVEEVEKTEEVVDEVAETILKTETFDGAEVVKKYDSWQAGYDNETLADELSKGNDGTPLGYYPAEYALSNVIKSLTSSGDTDKIPAACAEFGVLVQKLAELSQGKDLVMKAAFAKDVEVIEKEEVAKSEVEETPSHVFKSEEDFNTAVEAVVKSLIDPLAETVEKSCNRLNRMEQLKVTRKGATAPADTAPPTPEVVEKTEISPLLRNSLGILNQ